MSRSLDLAYSIRRHSVALALFAALTTLLVSGVHLATDAAIKDNIRQAEYQQLASVVGDAAWEDGVRSLPFPLPDNGVGLGLDQPKMGYQILRGHTLIAVVLPVIAPNGYSGDIDMLVGIDPSGNLTGVRVTRHRETPGLGDGIDHRKSDWILQFAGRSLTNPKPKEWGVKKDRGVFDQFTGATVTPRAVVHRIRDTLAYAEEHRDDLFAVATTVHTERE
jgi:electron transport complex protein RnfG